MSSSSGPHLEPFCSSCQAFKIDRNRFRSSPFEEKRVHQLGTWDEIRARSCALCRLIASAYHGGLPESILARSRCHGGWAQLSPSSPDACITIWLTPWIEDKRIGLSIRLVGNENGDGTLIQDSWIDVNQVRNWIRICQTKHSCKNVPLDMTRGRMLPEEFMVIDVIKKCLVTPGRSCRFLALSYVWGNSVKFKTTSQNVESLRTEGAFDVVVDQLSPTIRDSMNLTRRLGEQFIWVDSLCILQDNAESSQANIQAMDLIYRQATLVILAADDEAPTKGLLGVSTNPRTATQFSSEILPGLQVMARFNHTTAMDQTVYRTRGWTYQEEQLSTRALIFTNNLVYFTCPQYVFAEDIVASPNADPDADLVGNYKQSRYIREDSAASSMYFQSVQHYTSRKLTYSSDILNGFRGVEAVQCQFLSTTSLSGLPTSLFDMSLLWQPSCLTTRRDGFPSWSWTGWEGSSRWDVDTSEFNSGSFAVNQELEHDHTTKWLRKRTWIVWHYFSPIDGIQPIWNADNESKVDSVSRLSSGKEAFYHVGYDPEASTKGNVYGRDLELTKRLETLIPKNYFETRPSFLHLSKVLSSISKPIYPLLFETVVTKFYIRPTKEYLRYGSVGSIWQANGRVVFHLLNRNSQISGYVLLDDSWFLEPEPVGTESAKLDQLQDFVLLSEANYYCDWRRPHEDHPYKRFYDYECWEEFHVMMVVWKTIRNDKGEEIRVAERAGKGRVLKEAVPDACEEGAKWKDIIMV